MMDFTTAIAEGVSSAKFGASNMEEIANIVRDLSDQLKEFTKGRVSVEIREAPPTNPAKINLLEAITSGKSLNKNVLLVSDGVEQVIARFGTAEMGYPCKLSYGGQITQINDKDALGLAFADLFKTHKVGSVLLDLMNDRV